MWGSFDPVLEFGDPLISRERLKLETSNLAQRWKAVSSNEKMQNWFKSGHMGSIDQLLEFWDPLISRERLKLHFQIWHGNWWRWVLKKKCKIGSKGVMWGSLDALLNFWEHPNISRTIEATNLKFGSSRTAVSSNKKSAKLGQKGSCGSHVTHFWNFGIPYYLGNGWS